MRGDEIRDLGTCCTPLLLTMLGPSALQDLINDWGDSADADSHLLYEAPNVLCLQIDRFRFDRKVRKVRYEVDLQSGSFTMPGRGLLRLAYQVRALSIHLGETPTSGHYRTILIPERGASAVHGVGPPAEEFPRRFPGALSLGSDSHQPLDDTSDVGPSSLLSGAWYTDDFVPATQLLTTDIPEILSNVYLMWCIRV